MKSNRDVAAAWLRKAASDLTSARLCLRAGESLDAACFHCQQAAEKALKAYLIFAEIPFPFTHDVAKLLELCVANDSTFSQFFSDAASLTPYAVALRYDEEFWPDPSTTAAAVEAAQGIVDLVTGRLAARN